MEISVIIPVYKDFVRLNKLLESLKLQTFDLTNFEVIVVNNDPENPKLGLNPIKCPYLIKEIHEAEPGSYAARNRGIKEAKGKIIGFTDSDMIPDSKWLEVAFRKFKCDIKKEIGILTGPVPLFYRDLNNLTNAEIYEKYTGFDFEGYAKEGATGAGNWFSYKSILDEFGCFREDLKSNGDTELSLRISQKYKLVYLPELVNWHPARYKTAELVFRYRRILGGTYSRKFQGDSIGFFFYLTNFIYRRYRFSIKKFLTVSMNESWAIFKVCNALSWGASKEFFRLISGKDTKR